MSEDMDTSMDVFALRADSVFSQKGFHTPTKSQQPRASFTASHPASKSLITPTKKVGPENLSQVEAMAISMMYFVTTQKMISLASNQVEGLEHVDMFVFRVPDRLTAPKQYQSLYAITEEKRDWEIVINGSYSACDDAQILVGPEGSVSEMPEKQVSRWSKIHATWIDVEGNEHSECLEGLAAKIFQNKVCYLHGLPVEAIDDDTFMPPRNIDEINAMNSELVSRMVPLERDVPKSPASKVLSEKDAKYDWGQGADGGGLLGAEAYGLAGSADPAGHD